MLRGVRAILLDFDGPICDLFAAYPAPVIADELRQLLNDQGVELPPRQQKTHDPWDLIRWTAVTAPRHARKIEAALTAREAVAAGRATPTPGTARLLRRCAALHLPVAVVSNNAATAVATYLNGRGLGSYVLHIQGRDPLDVQLMKPNPHPIRAALDALGVGAPDAVFVGDSVSDLVAGRAASVQVIAYASKPGKAEVLADADILIGSMELVAAALPHDP